MYVTDDFVYVQLQKTACTHIARLLAAHYPGRQIGKHNRPDADLLASGRKIIGSVRNPWDWYVSLWAFGCGGKGGLHERLTSRVDTHRLHNPLQWVRAATRLVGRSAREWREVYANRHDPALFQRWLQMMFDPNRARELGEGYGDSSLRHFAGFFTYRYLYLFSRDESRLFDGSLTDHDALAQYAHTNNLLHFVVRCEHLEDDLLRTLTALGRPAPQDRERSMRSASPTNTSVRDRDCSRYYDHESAALVADRERLMVSRFGYAHPRRGHVSRSHD